MTKRPLIAGRALGEMLSPLRKGSALRRTLRPVRTSLRKAPDELRKLSHDASLRRIAALKWLSRRWGRYQLKRRGYLGFFGGRVGISTPVTEPAPEEPLKPDFSDLWYLYRLVRERKPKLVLEFGGGCSTYVLAQALYDNGREDGVEGGHLYSLDAEARWARRTDGDIPAHLKSVCEVWHSPVEVLDHAGISCFRHTKIPPIAPNMVYLDGPWLTPEVLVAIDVLDMEEGLPSDFLLTVDGRRANVAFLQRNLRREYRFKEKRSLGRSTFELIN